MLSSTGTWKGPFGYAGSFGYQEDADSSLKLLGHRYYDPSTGRFLTRDPIKDGRNWYVYCDNNPITGADPNGFAVQVVVAAAAVVFIGIIAIVAASTPEGQQASRNLISDIADAMSEVTWPWEDTGVLPTADPMPAYRRKTPGKEVKDHYPSGPHVDWDPADNHDGPHIDYPDTSKPDKPNHRLELGDRTYNPRRNPDTGEMEGLEGRRGPDISRFIPTYGGTPRRGGGIMYD